MAPAATELATLRALTFRISSTPTVQLPQHVPAIAASLANCRTLLSSPQTSGSKASSSEASVAVHKYRTLISTLIQDRTVHGRWSAVVLIKATIEVGGWETLQKCLPWVRGLLGFLNKPDPPSLKKLCIITLTRIFILTREYPTLTREITTPSLPTFVQATLQLSSSSATSLLQTVLECYNELLPRHSTIFRSYLKQLQPLLSRLVAPTPTSKIGVEQDDALRVGLTSGVVAAARQLHVQIPCCAPKGASSEDWTKAVKSTVNSAHQTADRVFRAVLEDWQPTSRAPTTTNGHTLDDDAQNLEPDSIGLPPWSGIFAGGERLIGVLHILAQYLHSPTINPVYLNLGMLMDLVTRLLSLTVPATGRQGMQNATRVNNQVSKEERENLWLVLPDIHVATVELLLALAQRCRASTITLDTLIIDQLVWVFGAEKETAQLRTAIYLALAGTLKRSGVTLHKSTIDSLVPLIRTCCDDVLPSELDDSVVKQTPGQAKANGNSQPQASGNADAFLNSSKATASANSGFAGLREAAYDLLPILLGNIRAQYFSDSLRARLDRTAILAQHKDAMVASVLNPPPSKKFGKPAASILPLMARSFPSDKDVEGLLRPRMPAIRLGGQDPDMEEDAEDEVDDEEEEASEDAEMQEADDYFAGNELDTLLESAGQTKTSLPVAVAEDTSTPHHQSLPDFGQLRQDLTMNVTIPEPSQFSDMGKRSLAEKEAPSSSSKRVKFAEELEVSVPAVTGGVVEPVQTSTASVASAVPESSTATGELDSDDDDDIVPLVFGQDTDDESE